MAYDPPDSDTSHSAFLNSTPKSVRFSFNGSDDENADTLDLIADTLPRLRPIHTSELHTSYTLDIESHAELYDTSQDSDARLEDAINDNTEMNSAFEVGDLAQSRRYAVSARAYLS